MEAWKSPKGDKRRRGHGHRQHFSFAWGFETGFLWEKFVSLFLGLCLSEHCPQDSFSGGTREVRIISIGNPGGKGMRAGLDRSHGARFVFSR